MIDSVGHETQTIDSLLSADSVSSMGGEAVLPMDSMQSEQISKTDSLKSPVVVNNYDESTPTSLSEPALKRLHYLEGLWKGEAWIIDQNREKQYIIQTEKVELKQGGKVITIDGIGIDKESLRTMPKVVHDAFALIYFSEEKQKIQMMAFNQGRQILTEPVIGADSSLVWGFNLPNVGNVRYTIRLNGLDQWFEIGEFSRDGVQWFQNFEMTLDKIE
ncbi:MAG: hypothetical protein JSW33_10710 [bacterium]|nr:MAG: hypothetical protein JSW33_10710 [bacterium]